MLKSRVVRGAASIADIAMGLNDDPAPSM